MRKRLVGLVAVLSFSAACTPERTLSPEPAYASDQAVYSVVLDTLFARNARSASLQIVVSDSTRPFDQMRLIKPFVDMIYSLSGKDSTALHSFFARGREPHSLDALSKLNLGKPVVLVDRATLTSLPHGVEPYWRRFYELYPASSGHISLSAIGYNGNADTAILMVDQFCGGLCGNGYMISLRRRNGAWYINAIERTWIS